MNDDGRRLPYREGRPFWLSAMRRALAVWNNTGRPQEVAVEVDWKRLIEAAIVDGTLAPQEVAVLLYE